MAGPVFKKMILDELQGIKEHIHKTILKKLAENYKYFDAQVNEVSGTYADGIIKNLKPNEQLVVLRAISDIFSERKN